MLKYRSQIVLCFVTFFAFNLTRTVVSQEVEMFFASRRISKSNDSQMKIIQLRKLAGCISSNRTMMVWTLPLDASRKAAICHYIGDQTENVTLERL
jgi:hypothetical protein